MVGYASQVTVRWELIGGQRFGRFSCVDAAISALPTLPHANDAKPANSPDDSRRTRRVFFTCHNCHGAGYEYTLLWGRKERAPSSRPPTITAKLFVWKSATDNEKGRRPPGGTSESAALVMMNRIGPKYCAASEAGELSVVTGGSREAALFPL